MTLKRVRVYAFLMAVALWAVVAVDYASPGAVDRFGKIKGTDFVQFYAGGALVAAGRADRLYDTPAFQAAVRDAVPAARDAVYIPIQSPQLAVLFAPLARLPYTAALAIWLLVLIGLYVWACRLLWRRCGGLQRYRREAIACAVAFPGLYATVIHGQTSVFALLAMVAALLALERGRPIAAGLAAGCLAFKPHWLAAAGLVFLAAREWRVLAGLCVSAAAQLTAAFVALGSHVFAGYLSTLLAVGRLGDLLEPRPGYSLRSFFTVFVPAPGVALALFIVAAGAVAWLAARVWRSQASFELRASALVLALVLVNPHVYEYDLLVLAPVFFFLANDAAAGGRLLTRSWTWVAAALYVAPMLTALPAPVRLQFSVTAMVALLVRIRTVGRDEPAQGMNVNLAEPDTLRVSPSSDPPTGRARVVMWT